MNQDRPPIALLVLAGSLSLAIAVLYVVVTAALTTPTTTSATPETTTANVSTVTAARVAVAQHHAHRNQAERLRNREATASTWTCTRQLDGGTVAGWSAAPAQVSPEKMAAMRTETGWSCHLRPAGRAAAEAGSAWSCKRHQDRVQVGALTIDARLMDAAMWRALRQQVGWNCLLR